MISLLDDDEETSTTTKGRREAAVVALAYAVAERPWNMDQIQEACNGIRDVVPDKADAEGLILEVCLTAANFEAVTKIVDGTMRKRLSSLKEGALTTVNWVGRTVRRILRPVLGW